jgi:hypothetical protein
MSFLVVLRRLSSKRVLAFFTVLFILTIAALPIIQESSDNEVSRSPDMSFFYTVEELYEMAESYGAEGRRNYIIMRFTFDLVFPLIYGGFLISALGWLYDVDGLLKWRNRVVLLPFSALLFDYLENISTATVMWFYPTRVSSVGVLATFFTPIKWILLSCAFLALIPGLIIRIRDRLM